MLPLLNIATLAQHNSWLDAKIKYFAAVGGYTVCRLQSRVRGSSGVCHNHYSPEQLNCQSLERVSRYRDPQLEVTCHKSHESQQSSRQRCRRYSCEWASW